MLIRPAYSSAPLHPALLLLKHLSSDALYEEWCGELKLISARLQDMRTKLRQGLEARQTPGDWSHITSQIGMFAFTGLQAKHVKILTEAWSMCILCHLEGQPICAATQVEMSRAHAHMRASVCPCEP